MERRGRQGGAGGAFASGLHLPVHLVNWASVPRSGCVQIDQLQRFCTQTWHFRARHLSTCLWGVSLETWGAPGTRVFSFFLSFFFFFAREAGSGTPGRGPSPRGYRLRWRSWGPGRPGFHLRAVRCVLEATAPSVSEDRAPAAQSQGHRAPADALLPRLSKRPLGAPRAPHGTPKGSLASVLHVTVRTA